MKGNKFVGKRKMWNSVKGILQIEKCCTNIILLIQVMCNVFVDREKLKGCGVVFAKPD